MSEQTHDKTVDKLLHKDVMYHFKEGIVASKTMFKTGNEYSVIQVHILLAVL